MLYVNDLNLLKHHRVNYRRSHDEARNGRHEPQGGLIVFVFLAICSTGIMSGLAI